MGLDANAASREGLVNLIGRGEESADAIIRERSLKHMMAYSQYPGLE